TAFNGPPSNNFSGSVSFTWVVNPFALQNPGDQTNHEGDTVSLQTKSSSGATAGATFAATGLPPGLTIDASTGLISAIIGAYDADASPYTVTVSAYDGPPSNNPLSTITFTWNVSPVTPPAFTNPTTQSNKEGDSVSIATDPAHADAGSITSTGLPPGLTIDST